MPSVSVSSRVFLAVQRVDVSALAKICKEEEEGQRQHGANGSQGGAVLPQSELRPVLACLVRMSLIASLDKSKTCSADRTAVLQVLSRIELVNNLVALLSIDFHALETDVRKERQSRWVDSMTNGDKGHWVIKRLYLFRSEGGVGGVLVGNLSLGPALEFERSDATRRLRLVLAELISIMAQVGSFHT